MDAPWLDELNPAQRRAATHLGGPVLVIAGAGSGKTKTLAARVAWLLHQGVEPQRIMLLTFTRRAAAEMLARAARLSPTGATAQVWGGTFHAIANRLLRQYGWALGLSAQFTVMDQGDAADLMNLIRSDLDLGTARRRFPRKDTLMAIYSRVVNSRTRLADVLAQNYPWCVECQDGIRQVFAGYTRRKRDQNVLDYDDLLLYWKALCPPEVAPPAPPDGSAAAGSAAAGSAAGALTGGSSSLHPDSARGGTGGTGGSLAETIAGRFEHILVDEYQDTNLIQAEVLQGMRRGGRPIMVVGDDAQSIYSFRAATVRNILDFPKQFPGATQITLEQNYRSTGPILAAANAVMTQAKERYTKNLFTTRTGGQKPALITCADEPSQCEQVCQRVLEKLEGGIALRRQAVLFRAGHHSDMLEVELTRRNIPFVKYGGLKFIEAAHIKDMLGVLRLLENSRDEMAWFRVLQLLDGVGAATARRIMMALGCSPASPVSESGDGASLASASPQSPAQATIRDPLHVLLTQPPVVPAAARDDFASFRRAIGDCQGEGGKAPAPAAQVQRVRKFYEPIFKRIYDNPAPRLRDLDQLEQIASGYTSRCAFVTDLTLDPPTSTQDLAGPPLLDEDYLVLSTIHSAKGCEWDVVHLIHVADGMMPSDMATGSVEEIDEERRLFYVALTRARDTLNLYFPLRYYFHPFGRSDRHSYAQLTRFLPPGAAECFQRIIAPGAGVEPAPAGQAPLAGTRQAVDRMLEDLWKA